MGFFDEYDNRINEVEGEEKIKVYLELVEKHKKCDCEYLLYNILKKFDDDIKIKYLNLFHNDIYKSLLVTILKDNTKKIELLNIFSNNYDKYTILSSIKDDTLLLDLFYKSNKELKNEIVLCISDETVQVSLLNELDMAHQVYIIKSLKDQKLKLKYALLDKYSEDKADILSSIDDENIIINYFKDNTSKSFRIELIKKINNPVLKGKLLEILDENLYKSMLYINDIHNKEQIMSNIHLDNINYNIDKNITIGVELESCNEKNREYLLFDTIFDSWSVKSDASVNNGVEITSPILQFDESSLKELYFICSFLHQNNFYVDDSCGGHIHLGFDYFHKLNEFKTFLNLYANCENILYIISNNDKQCRNGINKYAHSSFDVINKATKNIECTTLYEYARKIADEQSTKYYGLNLRNINTGTYQNTIEFRFPNGEIEFNNIVANIKLFAKLLEKSKTIVNEENKDINYLYNKLIEGNINNYYKLSLLLSILFENDKDKQIYIDRYNNTSNIGLKLIKRKVYIK